MNSGNNSESAHIRSTAPSGRISCDEEPPASHQFRDSDLLIERFGMWKLICGALLNYFEGMSGVQQHTSKELSRLGLVLERSLTLPLSSGLSWNEKGLQGLQALLWGAREDANKIAQEHDALAKLINSSIITQIQKLQAQVESNIANIDESRVKFAKLVDAEREKLAKLIKKFLKAIRMSQSSSRSLEWRQDPWYCHELLSQQWKRRIYQEGLLQKSVSMLQVQSAQFEQTLMRSIKDVWKVYRVHNDRMQSTVQPKFEVIDNWLQSLRPIADWETFTHVEQRLFNPALQDPSWTGHPEIEHPKTTAVHQGILRRKKKYKNFFAEGYFVLTPSGHMFQFKSASLDINPRPELSIYLPKCTLGAPTSDNSRFHQFSILIDKKNTFNLEPVYTFRAKSHGELIAWWNSIKEFCKLCSPSPTFIDDGPIATTAHEMSQVYVDESESDGHDDVPRPQHSTPVTSQDKFEIASGHSSDQPPRSISSIHPDYGDRQRNSFHDTIQQYHPQDNVGIKIRRNSEKKNLHDDQLAPSVQLVRSNYDDEQEFSGAHQVQQDECDPVDTISVKSQHEVERIPSARFISEAAQSTSSLSLDITTAIDRAFENETSAWKTKAMSVPSSARATWPSSRFQLAQSR